MDRKFPLWGLGAEGSNRHHARKAFSFSIKFMGGKISTVREYGLKRSPLGDLGVEEAEGSRGN